MPPTGSWLPRERKYLATQADFSVLKSIKQSHHLPGKGQGRQGAGRVFKGSPTLEIREERNMLSPSSLSKRPKASFPHSLLPLSPPAVSTLHDSLGRRSCVSSTPPNDNAGSHSPVCTSQPCRCFQTMMLAPHTNHPPDASSPTSLPLQLSGGSRTLSHIQ